MLKTRFDGTEHDLTEQAIKLAGKKNELAQGILT